MAQPHQTLIAWQRADDLCVVIYKLTQKHFPSDERFRLSNQLRRAAYSVAANIVEGYAFPAGAARLRFLRISVGSIAEVGYGLHLAHRIGYLRDDVYAKLEERVRMVAGPLHGLLRQQSGRRPQRK